MIISLGFFLDNKLLEKFSFFETELKTSTKKHIRCSTYPVKMILSTPKKHNPFGQYFQNLILVHFLKHS